MGWGRRGVMMPSPSWMLMLLGGPDDVPLPPLPVPLPVPLPLPAMPFDLAFAGLGFSRSQSSWVARILLRPPAGAQHGNERAGHGMFGYHVYEYHGHHYTMSGVDYLQYCSCCCGSCRCSASRLLSDSWPWTTTIKDGFSVVGHESIHLAMFGMSHADAGAACHALCGQHQHEKSPCDRPQFWIVPVGSSSDRRAVFASTLFHPRVISHPDDAGAHFPVLMKACFGYASRWDLVLGLGFSWPFFFFFFFFS